MVYRTVHVLDVTVIVRTRTVWITENYRTIGQNVNWRNCGCKRDGLHRYNWRLDAPRTMETQVLKLCWCNWLSGSISRTLSWDNPSSYVTHRELSGIWPTAANMTPSLAAVSTVRERRPFTISIAVYSSCLTQKLLQLLRHISVLVLSSTGTSTSTRLLQVPWINSMSPCVYFPVIR